MSDLPLAYYIGGSLAGVPLFIAWSFCLSRICLKVGREPGVLIWVPFLQLIPLMRVAGMPGWMLFMALLPCAQIIFVVMMWIGITKARGKPMAWAFVAAFPCTVVVGVPYLAFSE